MLTKTRKLFLLATVAILITLSVPTFIGYRIIELDRRTQVANVQLKPTQRIIDFETEEPVEVAKPVGPPQCQDYACGSVITHYDIQVSWVSDGPLCDSALCGSIEVAQSVDLSSCSGPTCGGDPIVA